MILRVLDSGLMRARALLKLSSQALSDIELKLPNRITFVQALVEALSLKLTETELDEKKAGLVRHSFTDYQKAILLNSIAKAYGDKSELVEKALHCFDETLALYPEYENALMSKANLVSIASPQSAIDAARTVLVNNPDHYYAYFRLGYCYHRMSSYENAIEQYKRCTEIDPRKHVAYNNLGTSLAQLNRQEDALEHFKKAVEINPKYVLAYDNWSLCLGNLGRLEEAIELCRKSIEIDSKSTTAHNRWGLYLGRLNRHEEALEHYQAAIAIDSSFVLAYDNWSWSLGQLARHEEAIELCKKSIELDPKNVSAYNRWGLNLGKLGRHKEAIELFRKAVELDPNYTQAHLSWADTLKGMSLYGEAIERYSIAIRINPKSADAYNCRGLVYSYMKKTKLAISDYAEAIAINSDELAYHYNMAIIKYVSNIDASYYIETVQSLCSKLSESDHRGFYAMAGIAAVKSDFDTALKKLNSAASLDYQSVREWALSDVAFERMRSLPEFQTIFEGQKAHR